MISYLTGTIQFKGHNYLMLLTAGGVGYKVSVPAEIITNVMVNEKYNLFTYTHVKEDALELYGFDKQEDLLLFEMFLGVSGIGPKTALSIFSNGKSGKIKEAIVRGDVGFFTSIPRLGTKNAQKIIIELRPKLSNINSLIDLSGESGETKEIIEALKSFGFNATEAREALRSINNVEGDTGVKIKAALKFLGKK
ncbi:Holliday junction branch migration protein RuvA [Patescibacteria group bacterium]|nr:Holliday junction branch migration protein RuvA [Patescibacteria group bacterium]MCL5798448.1 Holliday junction branch migration protein RuvA [Patescibacteria group bacterium]